MADILDLARVASSQTSARTSLTARGLNKSTLERDRWASLRPSPRNLDRSIAAGRGSGEISDGGGDDLLSGRRARVAAQIVRFSATPLGPTLMNCRHKQTTRSC